MAPAGQSYLRRKQWSRSAEDSRKSWLSPPEDTVLSGCNACDDSRPTQRPQEGGAKLAAEESER